MLKSGHNIKEIQDQNVKNHQTCKVQRGEKSRKNAAKKVFKMHFISIHTQELLKFSMLAEKKIYSNQDSETFIC